MYRQSKELISIEIQLDKVIKEITHLKEENSVLKRKEEENNKQLISFQNSHENVKEKYVNLKSNNKHLQSQFDLVFIIPSRIVLVLFISYDKINTAT